MMFIYPTNNEKWRDGWNKKRLIIDTRASTLIYWEKKFTKSKNTKGSKNKSQKDLSSLLIIPEPWTISLRKDMISLIKWPTKNSKNSWTELLPKFLTMESNPDSESLKRQLRSLARKENFKFSKISEKSLSRKSLWTAFKSKNKTTKGMNFLEDQSTSIKKEKEFTNHKIQISMSTSH